MTAGLLRAGRALSATAFADLRRRAIFECCKWDPQAEDECVLAPFPLLLDRATWTALAAGAEALAHETLAAEERLLAEPALARDLGLPGAVRRALAQARRRGAPAGVARVLRFDFHPTTDGWRVSEVNSDVPGGFVEASGVTSLLATGTGEGTPAGDPAESLARAAARAAPAGGTVVLAHATAYVDDHQVMAFLSRRLEGVGLRPVLASPAHLRWDAAGRASVECAGHRGPVDLVLRFFPAEWLPHLPRRSGWPFFFRGARTPVSNPGSALLTQSKRLPLVLRATRGAWNAWREWLPETRDPREVDWRRDESWVLKPALGRVGESVAVHGVTDAAGWRTVGRDVRRRPGRWVAQRRFASVPVETPGGALHACVGVFVVDGRAAGAYGRLARRALIDHRAVDAPVLVLEGETR